MTVRDLVILGCSSQQHTRTRNQGAYLVRWNEQGFLFDPGEGTQRQFIFANVAPTYVTSIFVSHFHGDHCLGLGSILMRLNLDKVPHPIHCYYPGSGQVYFDRLRFGTIYHQNIQVIEHPIFEEGIVVQNEQFKIEARFLQHGVDNIGWRITEADTRKFDKSKLDAYGIKGPMVREIEKRGEIIVDGARIILDDVSHVKSGDVLAVAIDTLPCSAILDLAKYAKLFICESTYLERHRDLAHKHYHLTAKQAAEMALKAGVETLVLTHFSARYQDLEEFAQEAQSIFPQTIIAEDFKIIPF